MFCRVLGSVAGNLALTLGARGGVYIAGGIVPRFIDFIEASEFRQRFDSKGRFSNYLRDIPVRVITKEDLGLSGAVKRLKMLDL
jgi:glucokinase